MTRLHNVGRKKTLISSLGIVLALAGSHAALAVDPPASAPAQGGPQVSVANVATFSAGPDLAGASVLTRYNTYIDGTFSAQPRGRAPTARTPGGGRIRTIRRSAWTGADSTICLSVRRRSRTENRLIRPRHLRALDPRRTAPAAAAGDGAPRSQQELAGQACVSAGTTEAEACAIHIALRSHGRRRLERWPTRSAASMVAAPLRRSPR